MFDDYQRITARFDLGSVNPRLPFMALAILCDPVAKFVLDFYRQELAGTIISYSFPVYKILDQSAEKLLKSNNPFALVVLTCLTVLQAQKRIKSNLNL